MAGPDHQFQGGHFNYSIDLANQHGETVDFLGGMNNAYAARRAYEMLLICHNPPTRCYCARAPTCGSKNKPSAVQGWVLARSGARENQRIC